MKTKYNIFIIAFLLFIATSCNKSLELQSQYQFTATNALVNLDGYAQQLNGVYGSFASANYYNGFLGTDLDILTDNLYETIESLVNYQKVANWDYLSDEGYMTSVWAQPYNVIYQSNIIITGIDKFKSENEPKYNRILGQALVARAIAHFDLLKAYSNDYDRNATTLAVPIKTTADLSLPARNTVKEVYDLIYADLNKAITLLSTVDIAINSATNKANLDIWSARAELARVALNAKDYATAITQSTLVINQFPLATKANFPGIWNDANVNEVVWAIQNNSGDAGSPYPSVDVMTFRANRNTFGIHPSLLNLYDNINDVRFNSYFYVRNTTGAISNYGLTKYKGRGTAADNLVNYKVFRVAEQYLIRAEANALSTPAQELLANGDINTLRAARITGWLTTNYTGATLQNEIMIERRKELVTEGQRWFDLKRTTRIVNRPTTGLGNPNGNIKTSLISSSTKWNWPIPVNEIQVNSSITQNAGY